MTNAPSDLLTWRNEILRRTGLTGVSVGIVGDDAHASSGGYHIGKSGLIAIGRYHAPPTAHVGSDTEDYSARLLRDRQGLDENASAADIGDDWPHGGRAAWLRYNNLVAAALKGNDPALAPMRAINYSSNGTNRLRISRESGFAEKPSTDSVTTHTHHEWYRDTEGRRTECLARLLEFIDRAIAGGTVSTTSDDKIVNWIDPRVEAMARMYARIHNSPTGEEVAFVSAINAIRSQVSALASQVGTLTSQVSALSIKLDSVAGPAPTGDVAVSGTLHVGPATP